MSGASIAEELIGKNAVDLIAPEDREIAVVYTQKTLLVRFLPIPYY